MVSLLLQSGGSGRTRTYTASNTSRKLPAASRLAGDSPTAGCMPTEVVLSRTSPGTPLPCRASKGTASPPTSAASCWARPKFRLATTTRAPFALAPNASALPAPPAPMTTATLPSSAPAPPSPSSTALIAASQSVLVPKYAPSSARRTSVLTAPMDPATGSTSPAARSAASLWGMVTLKPEKRSSGSAAARNAGRSSTRSGT